MKKNNKEKKGYILISVLVIMVIMLIMTYFLADALFSELAIARNQKSATVAFNLAEAGVSEAVWRLQNDPTTRDTFLNTTNGQTNFSHDPALLDDGSYTVNITNSAIGAAAITATGYYKIGLKTAQRKVVVNVAKASTPPPYEYDGAIFTGGSTGNEDILFTTGTTANITGGGSLISNRNIELDWFSDVNVEKDAIAKGNISIKHWSDLDTGGVQTENSTEEISMPTIDVTSDDPNSYKSKAIAQGQYYTTQQFKNLLNDGSETLSGIVYVAGSVNVDWWQTLTINGILVAEGSIDIGGPLRRGTLTVNHVAGQPSGVITLNKFTAWAYSKINITGLVYVGDRFSFDPWYSLDSGTKAINITGGILCRRFEGKGVRTINIIFNRDLINEALLPDPDETPIIQTQHWEEEY